MLEQAILDAKELKEAAIKNAQQALIEKYSGEFEGEIERLLEQAAPDPAAAGAPPAGAPPMGAPPAAPGSAPVDPEKAKSDSDSKSNIFDKLEYAYADGEIIGDKVYPTGLVEIDLDSISQYSFKKNQETPEQMALQELKALSQKTKLNEELEEEMHDDEDYDEDSDTFPYEDEELDSDADELSDLHDFNDDDEEDDEEDLDDEDDLDVDIEDEDTDEDEDLDDEDYYGTEDDVGFHIDYDSDEDHEDSDYDPDADVEDHDDEEDYDDEEDDSEEDEEEYDDEDDEEDYDDEEDEYDDEEDDEEELEETKKGSKAKHLAKKGVALAAAASTMFGSKEQENIHKAKKSKEEKHVVAEEELEGTSEEKAVKIVEDLISQIENTLNVLDTNKHPGLAQRLKRMLKTAKGKKEELQEAIKLDWKRSGPRSPWNGMFREEGEHDVALAELQAQIAELEQEAEDLKESNKKLKSGLRDSIKLNENLNKKLSQYEQKLHESRILNYKLLYTNKALSDSSLNGQQKEKIAESISNAKTAEEVKLLYETLKSTMRDGTSRSTPKSLSEAVERRSSSLLLKASRAEAPKQNDYAERMKKLAGLA